MNTSITARLARAQPDAKEPTAASHRDGADGDGFGETSIDAESVVSGFALLGLACVICLLLASCFDAGVLA